MRNTQQGTERCKTVCVCVCVCVCVWRRMKIKDFSYFILCNKSTVQLKRRLGNSEVIYVFYHGEAEA